MVSIGAPTLFTAEVEADRVECALNIDVSTPAFISVFLIHRERVSVSMALCSHRRGAAGPQI